VKTYESSTATLRALLAHPSLQRDAVDRTLEALADANADARELDEAVRSGMDVASGVEVPPEDDEEIQAELAALEAEARAEARAREKTQQVVESEVMPRESASEAVEHTTERTDTYVGNERERRPVPVG